MAVPDMTPVAAMGNPVTTGQSALNPLQTMDQVLGLAQRTQQLQSGALELQQQAQRNAQIASFGTFVSSAVNDPKYRLANGDFDAEKFRADAIAQSGPYALPLIGSAMNTVKDGIDIRKSLMDLGFAQRSDIVHRMLGAAQQAQTNIRVDEHGNVVGYADPATVLGNLKTSINNLGKVSSDPGYQENLKNILQDVPWDKKLDDTTQINKIVDHVNGLARQTFALDSEVKVFDDGNEYLWNKDTNTKMPIAGVPSITPAGQPPSTLRPPPAAGSAPPQGSPPPQQQPPAAAQQAPPQVPSPPTANPMNRTALANAAQQATDQATAARTEDAQYGNRRELAQMIRGTVSNQTTAIAQIPQELQDKLGSVGFPGVTNAQELQHLLMMNTQAAMEKSGIRNTNAGAAEAQIMTAHAAQTPDAIRLNNNIAEAQNEGLHMYRQMIDKVAPPGRAANPDLVNRANAAWASNYSPGALEINNAIQRLQSSKPGSAEAKDAQHDLDELQKRFPQPVRQRMFEQLQKMKDLMQGNIQ